MNNRFNLYLHVHKGLRAFMADVLTTVGGIDAMDAVEVTSGVAQVRALLDLCRAHLFTENQFLHTAMEARRRGSSAVTGNEHVQQEEALEQIEVRLRAIARSSGTDRETKILDLYQFLALFVADNFQHMHVEEHNNNETLWALYTDVELQAIQAQILAALDPREIAAFLRWIFPYVSNRERAVIMAGLQKAAPEPVSHFN
jgi:hypothetical protein